MAETATDDGFEPVAMAADVRNKGPLVVQAGGRSIALFHHEGEFYATDNRCPHMGFPLTEGTVEDGILTCHWHHARFELSCGDTFDPWADDVPTFPLDIRDGEIFVNPSPVSDESPAEHWQERLEDGLQESLSLVIAKAVIGLDAADVPDDVPVRIGVEFGTLYREDGWGRGLTTLGVMTNLLEHADPEDRRRALYTGLRDVAADASGEPPFFVQQPFAARDLSPDRLSDWFRENIEVRDSDGAERVLRTAIQADLPESAIVAMVLRATTDHRYLDTGHRLDFTNKAFEMLDRLGWDHADLVLPSLVPGLASAARAEETSSWRQPIDIAALLEETFDDLPALARKAAGDWTEPEGFVDELLAADPHRIVETVASAIDAGASATQLANAVTYAATRRVAQFGTSNEFSDWNTVHHTFTYANAVHGLARRTDAWEAYRGVFDAAMNVYLDRFLNMPPTPIPEPSDSKRAPEEVLDALMETFEIEASEEVDRTGRLVAEYLDVGGDIDRLKRSLTHALVREDAGFHPNQHLEASFARLPYLDDPERRRVTLIAAGRYLSAHTPTRREAEQTFRIADRLHRGEALHEGAGN